MIFFVGLHQPSDAKHFDFSMISVNRLRKRKGPFAVRDWIMDSGAFTEITKHGCYRSGVAEYAHEIRRWSLTGSMRAAVSQDYMCEPVALKSTGLTVEDHQRLTVERYCELENADTGGSHILPVLQGYEPDDYLRHLGMYGSLLVYGMWVGIGSICKRNGKPEAILKILGRLTQERPDLKFHGFGLKTTALANPIIKQSLFSADSMAWSFAARRQGRNPNDWREAKRFEERVQGYARPEKIQSMEKILAQETQM